MLLKLVIVLLGAYAHLSLSERIKCERNFRKVGCFVRNLNLVPDLLITDLDPTHKNYQTRVDWDNYADHLHSLACRCREKALAGHYKYFGIGMYGECMGGRDNAALEKLFKDPEKASYSCIHGNHNACDVNDIKECTGTVDHDFFYEIVEGRCSAFKKEVTYDAFTKQSTLTKNNLVKEFSNFGKEFQVSFEVFPTKFEKQWANIIHFSAGGGDNAKYGDRNPAVWFNPYLPLGRLHISSGINGITNQFYNTAPMPLNKWTKVTITQRLQKDGYVYSIRINEKQVYRIVNKDARSFEKVKMYVANPWYQTQPGFIRNLKVIEIFNKNEQALEAFKSQKPMVKNQLVTTYPKLSKEFEVSFEVYPTKFISGWANVFHMTAGGNVAVYGDRVPAIWFNPSSPSAKTNRFHVCSAVSGNSNYCYQSQAFPLNKWIKIKVSQTKKAKGYEYNVLINDKNVMKRVNSRPVFFDNVKLYVGDPWYEAQPGFIRNIQVHENCDANQQQNNINILQAPDEVQLKKDTLLGSISTLCKEYQMSLDVKPTAYGRGWRSVLHVTLGGNYFLYGDRAPGIWFNPSSALAKTNRFHVCSPINGQRNYCYNSKPFPLNQWINIKTSQKKEGNDYIYRIHVNGKEVLRVKNTKPRTFYDLQVYAADPWYIAQSGTVKNININGGICV